jgi:hypothetical protein
MAKEELDRLERSLLVHLLDHRGQQVRFEADQWTTEFGIFRAFAQEDAGTLKVALRSLEMGRYVYRRVQYVIGYSEPKLVFSLTPSGHRKAVDLQRGPTTPPVLAQEVGYAGEDAPVPTPPGGAPDT